MSVTIFTDNGSGVLLSNVLLDDGDIKLKLGKKYYFDSDLDTYLSCAVDDVLDLYVAGSLDVIFRTNNVELQAGTALTSVNGGRTVTTYAPFIPIVAQQALSGPGAISETTYYTTITTTGADAFTLADSESINQFKKIQMIVDGGDATITPTTLSGGTTITLADVGDTVELVWTASGWLAVALYNVVDGATAPVVA